MQLYLIRHGESFVNRDNWESLPSMDTGLTEKGHRQAARLRDWLREQNTQADALYCSTMRRAQETATYVREALGLACVADDRLREIGNNDATGKPFDEAKLPRQFHDGWAGAAPFAPSTLDTDNGESWMHLRVRLAQFVDEIAQQHLDQRVYVVAHTGVIAAIYDNVFNVGPYRRCGVHQINTGWTLFEYQPNDNYKPWMLRHHNRIDHLIGTDLV